MSNNKVKPLGPGAFSSPSQNYLLFYNAFSLFLRTVFLFRALQIWGSSGYTRVFGTLHIPALFVEGLAALDVLHAAAGLLGPRVSPATAALQVAGRNTVLWAVARNYPDVVQGVWHVSLAYAAMVVVWNIADVIRFGYYCVTCMGWENRAVGSAFKWLRYNAFIILYPLGVLSEMAIVYNVIEPSKERNAAYPYLLWFGLSLYAPAFYILYGHMLAQRRKQASKSLKRV
ncbi:hypothetical protein VTJ83DRAFT_7021 [Remersonia thermophila]|uniref:Very-long-chain (3R)-3-hydroxyacyl-CoA dehydratase n=1 Tax=Remersonia thermophila TaxID=72144 RepID=A0ABR4D2A3_9PEZI